MNTLYMRINSVSYSYIHYSYLCVYATYLPSRICTRLGRDKILHHHGAKRQVSPCRIASGHRDGILLQPSGYGVVMDCLGHLPGMGERNAQYGHRRGM